MKLLVTGGAGFIGSNFIEYWLQWHPEDQINVLDVITYAGDKDFIKRTNVALEAKKGRVKFYKGDITNPEDVNKAIKDCDVVVHFAAESHVDRSISDPEIFTRTNVLGTQMLLDAAREHDIKHFHHVSTDEVFGSIPLDENRKFNENSFYHPSSPYAVSKAESDNLVKNYFVKYNLPITITNCSNNFGPYQHPEKFIPRSIIRLLRGQNIRLYTPGNQVRDWLYVGDHCRAIDAVINNGNKGETYCVGGMAEEVNNLYIAKVLLSILKLPESRIEFITDRPDHDVKYAVDWSKIKNELGWKPEHNINQWLLATVGWYKNNEAWWKPLVEESEQFYQTKGEKVLTN